jgi:uncharacterized phage protein (TIGR02220 family)
LGNEGNSAYIQVKATTKLHRIDAKKGMPCMSTSPAFQFYPGDWLSSARIACMTLEQEGAYIRLISYDWMKDGIPDDDEELAILSRMGQGWLKGGSRVVRKCFQPHPTKPGFLTNERVQKERVKQAEWRKKSRIGGINSAKSRGSKDLKGGSRVVDFGSNQKPTLQSSSSSSSSDRYHEHSRAALFWLNEKTGKQFREAGGNLAIISARLSEPGVTIDSVKQTIDRQCALWKDDPKMSEFLRPKTIFGKENFEQYHGSRLAPIVPTANGNGKPHVKTAAEKSVDRDMAMLERDIKEMQNEH